MFSAVIKASSPQIDAWFGFSVAISGNTLVVGSPQESGTATGINGDEESQFQRFSGAAYVFLNDDSTWMQRFYVKASNTSSLVSFGRSVSVSGDTLVSGAQFERSGAKGINGDQNNWDALSSGAVYVFR
jgi:trimeric autotransporter adhesin